VTTARTIYKYAKTQLTVRCTLKPYRGDHVVDTNDSNNLTAHQAVDAGLGRGFIERRFPDSAGNLQYPRLTRRAGCNAGGGITMHTPDDFPLKAAVEGVNDLFGLGGVKAAQRTVHRPSDRAAETIRGLDEGDGLRARIGRGRGGGNTGGACAHHDNIIKIALRHSWAWQVQSRNQSNPFSLGS
jgi:hypothetical protein